MLRNVYPKTLNLGSAGAGPLIEPAILKEYVAELKPQVVLWFYYEGNDLSELTQEYDMAPTLRRYLESDFRQGLDSKQESVDRGLKLIVNSELAAPEGRPRTRRSLLGTLLLRELRHRILSLSGWKEECSVPAATTALFDRVLNDAKRYVNLWEGDLYFVYLPSPDSGNGCNYRLPDFKYRDQVISIAKNNGIPVIDLTDVFRDHPDPASLWAMRMPRNHHYNDAGYELVADQIVKRLGAP